jgi:hypothetical protein
LPRLGSADRQEIFERLCDMQEAEMSVVHQAWVDEAMASGPPTPATESDWDRALERGLARAQKGM